ncbi:hypothetical protein ACFOKJ_08890 [Vogesella amnigena]|uniref:Uncharacterized protein n=1 Tax=Vogesella amnigena TaxID=1507449 RepID=A0ABV7TU10_9NEIS
MKCSFFYVLLLGTLSLPALAACPPEAWMCAGPLSASGRGNVAAPVDMQETVVLQAGSFSLAREGGGRGERISLRPTWQLDEDTRLSFKLGRNKAELRLKMDW